MCEPDGQGLYHEKQRLELCAVHALNNLLQCRAFGKEDLDEICGRLSPGTVLNPHRSLLGTGNYDVNILMAALVSQGLAPIWWDKRRSLDALVLSQVYGFILNIPSNVTLAFVTLPIRRRHWIAVREVNGHYYNLDSKLKSPARIGGSEELRVFLEGQIAEDVCELLLVVKQEVEESKAWLRLE
ncbi:josephin-2 [Callorhinchus milii]|uniref:Josephin-2 n=1 Tax=Callorhinchus milii TaxID=7868 RepID=V9L647_CALMI|nr:josephin-2 [Callorhinchus milii]|eukprot:gi/632982359/ref/XP_007908092.1/ PREDICTED: josephin-2 [Callorhinchus milii]